MHCSQMRGVVWLPLLCVACGPLRHLGYDTSTVTAEKGPTLNAAVTVERFEDKRQANEPAIVFTAEDDPVTMGKQQVCFNIERVYATNVPDELRGIIERHLRQRAVIGAWNAEAEKYQLRGSLITLLGQQAPPPLSTGQVLGIAGLAAENATTTRPGQIDIVFRDLSLIRTRDGATRPLPDVQIHFKGDVTGVAFGDMDNEGRCQPIFAEVDAQLKQAVTTLASSVEQTIRAWSSAP